MIISDWEPKFSYVENKRENTSENIEPVLPHWLNVI